MSTAFAHGPSEIRLGDLSVPRLGFGAMRLTGPMAFGEPREPEAARGVLRRAIQLGIRLVDTAWYYGPHVTHRLIAEALRPYPKDLVIATKLGAKRLPDKSWVPAVRPEELAQGIDDDLRLLQLERIDLVHLRIYPRSGVPFEESLGAMIDLQKKGKVRHLGLSNVTVVQLEQALAETREGGIVSVQNLYNVAAGEKKLAHIGHAVVEGQEDLVGRCAEKGIAFLPFFPLAVPGRVEVESAEATPEILRAIAERRGVTEAQVAIAWLLARSRTMLPIPGTSSLSHLEENAGARSLRLEPDEIAAIDAARQ
jgi:aryl-alcohol dehydrogenase-like predicted oxidoreductase